MYRVVIAGVILGLALMVGQSFAQCDPNTSTGKQVQARDPNSLEAILDKLQAQAAKLTSYQCQVDYLVVQTLLESQARRKGRLFYAKFDKRSYLRLDFNTLQQNEEKEQAYREQYLFDGVWLTYIVYETKSVERHQIAEPNAPADAFTLINRHVPVLGFSKIGDLLKQFDIELLPPAEAPPSPTHRLHMKVKPDSVYKDDYLTIDFQIDRQVGLPSKILAVTTEEDINEIRLINPQVNQGIDRKVFAVDVPDEFSVETKPLTKYNTRQ